MDALGGSLLKPGQVNECLVIGCYYKGGARALSARTLARGTRRGGCRSLTTHSPCMSACSATAALGRPGARTVRRREEEGVST